MAKFCDVCAECLRHAVKPCGCDPVADLACAIHSCPRCLLASVSCICTASALAAFFADRFEQDRADRFEDMAYGEYKDGL